MGRRNRELTEDNPDVCKECGNVGHVKDTIHPIRYPTLIIRKRYCNYCKKEWKTLEVRGIYDTETEEWDVWF